MKKNANLNKVILALKRVILATFDDARWRELGYLTDSIDTITGHRRLLRSLAWGDPDYEGNVLEVIPRIIRDNPVALEQVEEFVGLEGWLRENDEALYMDLYGAGQVMPLGEVEDAGTKFDIVEINKHAARIRRGITDDPEQAIGSAKDLLETVLKAILGLEGQRVRDDIPALLKKAQKELELDPRDVDRSMPGNETIRRILGSLGQIVLGVSEIRNLYGTGHGRHGSRELGIAHTRLVVNAAITTATFLVEMAAKTEEWAS